MTSPPDRSAVAWVERALAPLDTAGSPVEVHETLAAVVQELTRARGVLTVSLASDTIRVGAATGDIPFTPGEAVCPTDELRAALDARTGALCTAWLPGQVPAEVWPVLALTRAVAAVAVVGAATREQDLILAAACRYAGLRLSQLYDAEVRADQLNERGAAIQTLRRMADTDSLTGVSNRSGTFAVLTSLLGRGERVGVVYLDLDGFKDINDTHGHSTGDRVLATVARRLRRVVRAPDMVGRLGGDEFVFVVRGGDEPALAHLVDRVHLVLREPVRLGELKIPVQASCGTAVATPGRTAAELIAAADARMYDNKRTHAANPGRVVRLPESHTTV